MNDTRPKGIQFSDLVDAASVRRLMELFYGVTGILSAILDADGTVVAAAGWHEICRKFHRENPISAARCRESDACIADHIGEGAPFIDYHCKNGLWDAASPILVEGMHVGTVFFGQFFYEDTPPDEEFFRAQAAELGFDEAAYLEALRKVPVFSRERVAGIMAFYSELAGLLSRMGQETLERRRAESELKGYKDRLEDIVEERTLQLEREAAERREAEAKYMEIFDSAVEGIYRVRWGGALMEANPATASILGYDSTGQMLRELENVADLYIDKAERAAFLRHLIESDRVSNYELHLRRRDGRDIWISTSARLKRDAEGNPLFIDGLATDITEHKRAETAFQEANERFALAADAAGLGVWDLDLASGKAVWDDRMHSLYNIDRRQFAGDCAAWKKTVHPDDLAPLTELMEKAIRDKCPFDTQFRIRWPDKTVRHIRALAKVLCNHWGEAVRMIGVSYDITDQVRFEQELKRSQALTRDIIDSLDSHIALLDGAGCIVMVNKSWRDFARENDGDEALLAEGADYLESCRRASCGDDAEKAKAMIEGIGRVLAGDAEAFEMEYPCHSPDLKRWFLLRAHRLNSGEPGCVAAHIDITMLRAAEENLRRNEALSRGLLDAITESAFLMDSSGRILAANETMAKRLGFDGPEAIIGKDAYGVVPPDIAEQRRRHVEQAKATKKPMRFLDVRKERVIDQVIYPVISESGRVTELAVFGRDVTDEKKALEELRNSEERLRRAVIEAPFPIMLHAEDGEVLLLSRRWTELSGYTLWDIPNTSDWEHFTGGDPSPTVRAARQRLFDQDLRVHEGEIAVRTKNGFERIWDFSSAPLGRLPDGRKLVISMAMDVTRRKRMQRELEQRSKDLERSNLELEQFAYVASHDLREPLRKVAGFAGLFAKKYRDRIDERGERYLWYIDDAVKRLQGLIDSLLLFSRVGRKQGPPEKVSMGKVLDHVLEDLELSIKENQADIRREELPEVWINPELARMLMQNLISNAIKFRSEAAPRIRIECRDQGEELEFTVKDNGIGVEREYADRIFGIFQRLHTREEYPGSGIGLAICKKIVEHYGGRIWLADESGPGAAFRFVLPREPDVRQENENHA